jgi:CDP-alcohol phosphatidyltransferase
VRPPELQDALNRYLYHPLAGRLALALRATPVTGNMLSVAGMLLIWGAAWSYVMLGWPEGALLGFALHLAWHVTDGADGDLARMKGTASPTGELVDGVCDYAGHTVMYIAFAFALDDWIGGWAWLAAILAGASHIAQTNHAETQRRNYLWWAYGVPWLKHARAEGDEVFAEKGWVSATFSWMALDYMWLSALMVPAAAKVDEAVAAAAGDPRRRRRIGRLVKAASKGSLLYQQALGANPRTIILGLSMLLGSPLWFFLAEIVALNLILIGSVRHHNQVSRRLAAMI